MVLTRRQFMKASAGTIAAIAHKGASHVAAKNATMASPRKSAMRNMPRSDTREAAGWQL